MNPNIMGVWRIAFMAALLVLMDIQALYAQDGFDFDVAEEKEALGIPISGRLSFESARQVDSPDRWIRLGPSLDLIYDSHNRLGQLYLEGTGRYNASYRIEDDSAQTQDSYEVETILRELFWKNNFGRWTLSVGKMISDPSVMDLLQVVDKVSVINRPAYFFAEPEEVKLGQHMIKLEYFTQSDSDLSLIVSPYPLFDRVADGDHPYALVKGRQLEPKEEDHDPEGSVYLNKRFAKGAVSLFAGRFNNRSPILEVRDATGTGPAGLFKVHAPFWSLGAAANVAVEPYLFKAEVAYNFEKPLQAKRDGMPFGAKQHDQVEAALGLDVNFGDAGLLTLELLADIPLERDASLAMDRTAYFGAVSWSNNYWNDELKVNVITLFPESLDNMINRFKVAYFLTNTLSVSAQYTRFAINAKEKDYGFMEPYDRIDFNLNIDFNWD